MSERVRHMRLLVFFDLPVGTARQRRNYGLFKRYLEKSGYLMMQESVYVKLAINGRVADGLIAKLGDNRPPEGLVQALKITEKQYATISCITGHATEHVELNDTEELVVL